ncbi:MAG: tRNA (guanosine(46)-N7)-methyltransferase TrmB [Alloprevotella sp.]|nr:tRNA (guanosine(46)-N7)-methyltransferase TrmB [Alloprevotella sp.]
MGHGKLRKFAEMETFPNVVQETPALPPKAPSQPPPSGGGAQRGEWLPSPMQGKWAEFFGNLKASPGVGRLEGAVRPEEAVQLEGALSLELGCGRGEYTVGLARQFPEKNFIGVDIKGARMWHGARQALAEQLTNAAFLRTNIEFIDRFFAPGEVSEIWLTFSDPQMKKPTKRLTSSYFLQRYRRIMPDGGIIHLKTDSNFLFTYTREVLKANGIEPEACVEDIYNMECEPVLREIRTYYEQMWLDRGIAIKYLRFRLPQNGALVEPDVEIPLDEYRSYNRHKRSGKETGK